MATVAPRNVCRQANDLGRAYSSGRSNTVPKLTA